MKKEETVQISEVAAGARMAGCDELGRMGLMDMSGRCEVCHSADDSGSLEPCRMMLSDRGEECVRCAAKRGITGIEGGVR